MSTLLYSSDPYDLGYDFDSESGIYVRREGGEEYYYDPDWEWECFESVYRSVFDSTPTRYVANGTVGRWNGTFAGGKIIDSFDDLLRMMRGYDDVKIYDDDGELEINLCHHDGCNSFTIRELTDKGERYYQNHPYDDVTEHIAITEGYTRKANLIGKLNAKYKSKARKGSKKLNLGWLFKRRA